MSMNDVQIMPYDLRGEATHERSPYVPNLEKFSKGVKVAIANSRGRFVLYGRDGKLKSLLYQQTYSIVIEEYMQYEYATVRKPELLVFMNHMSFLYGIATFWLTPDGILHAGLSRQANYRTDANNIARVSRAHTYFDNHSEVWTYRNNA